MSPLNSVRIHLSTAEWTFAIAAKVVPFCPLSFLPASFQSVNARLL